MKLHLNNNAGKVLFSVGKEYLPFLYKISKSFYPETIYPHNKGIKQKLISFSPQSNSMVPIFITGGTGYIGKRLIKKLVAKGYDVTALTRKGSENRLPKGVRAIIADPFDASTFEQWIPKGAIYIQLLGISHPSPRKKEQFREIDLKSLKTSADAAAATGVSHFIYVSVAMTDLKMMKEYRDVRKEGEAYLQSKHIVCTIIRPWYVVGPGHLWPLVLLPFYAVGKFIPSMQKRVEQTAFISIRQMLHTLMKAIDSPPQKLRVFEVKHMKKDSLPTI